MPRILHIQSSPNPGESLTRTLSDKFVQRWTATHANTDVEVLDLAKEPPPYLDADGLRAMMTPANERTGAVKERGAVSDRLIEQLEAADILVIGAPMINFTITAQLKSWFDHVTVAGRTFQYSAPGLGKGLLFGKKAFVVLARGGDYTDFPANAFDHHEPLIRMLLMFIGIYDVSFIRAQGMRLKEEEVPAILSAAEEVIERLAA